MSREDCQLGEQPERCQQRADAEACGDEPLKNFVHRWRKSSKLEAGRARVRPYMREDLAAVKSLA
jgi:hypothetical protein